MDREQVYRAVNQERFFQDLKRGTITEHPHEVGGWILIMEQLLADARKAWAAAAGDDAALEEVRKVVAVGVACLEQHGCPERAITAQHRQLLLGRRRERPDGPPVADMASASSEAEVETPPAPQTDDGRECPF